MGEERMVKEIPLTQGQVALVDDADFDWLNQEKWYATGHDTKNWGRRYYAARKVWQRPDTDGKRRGKNIWMHREILGTPDGMETDRVNHNSLDNRRANLRMATRRQNVANRKKIHRGGKSAKARTKFKGVSQMRDAWEALIADGSGGIHYLGCFPSPEEAALAYDNAAKGIYGEFACLNGVTPEQAEQARVRAEKARAKAERRKEQAKQAKDRRAEAARLAAAQHEAEEQAKRTVWAASLRGRRLAAGISQGELARRAGLHYSSISRLESGERLPSNKTIHKIEATLGDLAAGLEDSGA